MSKYENFSSSNNQYEAIIFAPVKMGITRYKLLVIVNGGIPLTVHALIITVNLIDLCDYAFNVNLSS